ncbi:MAG: type II secretion system protein [Terrimicrobiaceae bacterium]|nr:type II secretion system protein [Terrimicrobiaceae bacterium]
MKSDGMTLVEILVVVAIVGLLAAVLFPVAGRMQRAAQATKCATNMRSIYEGVILFGADNNGSLPSASEPRSGLPIFWTEQLHAQMGFPKGQRPAGGWAWEYQPVFWCPNGRPETQRRAKGYGMNANFLKPSGSNLRWAAVTSPAKKVLLAEVIPGGANPLNIAASSPQEFLSRLNFRHDQTANIVWADGHLTRERSDGEWLDAEMLTP